ncbi:granzyme A-like [Amblyraja radiata]|uniref:granzyme A-like n=1 Tax=Amblyraja radiata TaxID=386614 RepID=UPI001402C00F|nr:granzyme A-like [Amblyraja radiata]
MKLLKYGLVLPLISISFIPAYQGAEIIGGHDVTPHSKPYMASIQIFSMGKYHHNCGGALISRNWVLTAAHCEISRINAKQPLRVVLGAHSLLQDENQQSLYVLNQVPYPQYKRQTAQNDIMLLKLKGTATLNKFVNILKLPNSNKDVKSGTICNVAGWGFTNIITQQTPKVLQEVNVTVVDRNLCSKYYTYHPAITTNVLCAGDKKEDKDSCTGDSGGPLLCKGNFNGIVSFGCRCGIPKKPGVYTRLSTKYLSWIKKTILNSDFQ